MATIKLQDGKVVTRERNGKTVVQCECCGGSPPDECCMYPLDKLNILFTEDDWPEEGVFYHNNNIDDSLTGPIILEKQLANVQEGGLSFRIIYGSLPQNPPEAQNAVYYFPSILEGGYLYRQAQIDPGGENCLFNDLFDEENQPSPGAPGGNSIWWFDNFEDTYTVTQTQPARTFTVTRETQCIWRERRPDGLVLNSLYYDTKANEQNLANNGGVLGRILWRFNGVYRTDAGPYNSPEGVYGATDTWTVVG